jgi:hypothetical protein
MDTRYEHGLLQRTSLELPRSGGWRMSAIPPLSGDKQASVEWAKNGANEPERTSASAEARRCKVRVSLS